MQHDLCLIEKPVQIKFLKADIFLNFSFAVEEIPIASVNKLLHIQTNKVLILSKTSFHVENETSCKKIGYFMLY